MTAQLRLSVFVLWTNGNGSVELDRTLGGLQHVRPGRSLLDLHSECATLEEDRRRTTGLKIVWRSSSWSSARGSDTAVYLEERVRALERELRDVAAEAGRVRAEAEVKAEAWAAERAYFQEETHWTQLADAIEMKGCGGSRSRGTRFARASVVKRIYSNSGSVTAHAFLNLASCCPEASGRA